MRLKTTSLVLVLAVAKMKIYFNNINTCDENFRVIKTLVARQRPANNC